MAEYPAFPDKPEESLRDLAPSGIQDARAQSTATFHTLAPIRTK